MRVVQIGAVGTALAYLAFSYSQIATGFPQATAFMLAVLMATVTVGLGAAATLHTLPEDVSVSRRRQPAAHDCHGCGRPMVELCQVWVCARCDRVA